METEPEQHRSLCVALAFWLVRIMGAGNAVALGRCFLF